MRVINKHRLKIESKRNEDCTRYLEQQQTEKRENRGFELPWTSLWSYRAWRARFDEREQKPLMRTDRNFARVQDVEDFGDRV